MVFSRVRNIDPLILELREARRKMMVRAVALSYANREHTIFWALMISSGIFMALVPFRGIQSASLYSIGGTALWAMVHRVRRL
jgi:hypothetical protein